MKRYVRIFLLCFFPIVADRGGIRTDDDDHALYALIQTVPHDEIYIARDNVEFLSDPQILFDHPLYQKAGVFFFQSPVKRKQRSCLGKKMKQNLRGILTNKGFNKKTIQGMLQKEAYFGLDRNCFYVHKVRCKEALEQAKEFLCDPEYKNLSYLECLYIALQKSGGFIHINFFPPIEAIQYVGGEPFFKMQESSI